jgi:uncharacterized membrane protein HdeD (DUF308 family)
MGLFIGIILAFIVLIVIWLILAFALKKSKDDSQNFLIFGIIGIIIGFIIAVIFLGVVLFVGT